MKTRKINITIQIENNDLIEHQLSKHLTNLLGTSITDYRVLKDTRELYNNDEYFKKLVSLYKKAKKAKDDYIHKNLK